MAGAKLNMKAKAQNVTAASRRERMGWSPGTQVEWNAGEGFHHRAHGAASRPHSKFKIQNSQTKRIFVRRKEFGE
jgi:hypothetical protein